MIVVVTNTPAIKIEESQVIDLDDRNMLCVMITDTGKTYTLATTLTDDGVAERLVYPNGQVQDLDVKDPTDPQMAAVVAYLADTYC